MRESADVTADVGSVGNVGAAAELLFISLAKAAATEVVATIEGVAITLRRSKRGVGQIANMTTQ